MNFERKKLLDPIKLHVEQEDKYNDDASLLKLEKQFKILNEEKFEAEEENTTKSIARYERNKKLEDLEVALQNEYNTKVFEKAFRR